MGLLVISSQLTSHWWSVASAFWVARPKGCKLRTDISTSFSIIRRRRASKERPAVVQPREDTAATLPPSATALPSYFSRPAKAGDGENTVNGAHATETAARSLGPGANAHFNLDQAERVAGSRPGGQPATAVMASCPQVLPRCAQQSAKPSVRVVPGPTTTCSGAPGLH